MAEHEAERPVPWPEEGIGVLFGEWVRRRREKMGLSQYDLSRLSGVVRPNISRLESGKKSPTLETVVRVAWALNATMAEAMACIDVAVARAAIARRKEAKPDE